MNKNINEVANLLKKSFEYKTRENGKEFIVCNSSGSIKDFIHEEHDGHLPDDFIYKTIHNCIESVADGRTEISGVLEDVPADIYTYNLLKWSSSNLDRISYINDVLSESKIEDFNELLQHAQSKEIEEICYATLSFLESETEHTLDNDEEYDYE
jgi:hypothetical protein